MKASTWGDGDREYHTVNRQSHTIALVESITCHYMSICACYLRNRKGPVATWRSRRFSSWPGSVAPEVVLNSRKALQAIASALMEMWTTGDSLEIDLKHSGGEEIARIAPPLGFRVPVIESGGYK